MEKSVQRNRAKTKKYITCEDCVNCKYIECGDMICDQEDDVLIYEGFIPTQNYMWCKKKKFVER